MRFKWRPIVMSVAMGCMIVTFTSIMHGFIFLRQKYALHRPERNMKITREEIFIASPNTDDIIITPSRHKADDLPVNITIEDEKPWLLQKVPHRESVIIPPLLTDGTEKQIQSARNESLKYGKHRFDKAYMTIGIPTVSREWGKGYYLFETIDSLINNIDKTDLKLIVIVVYVTDFNQTWNEENAQKIKKKYMSLCEDGTLQIVKQQNGIYPEFSKLNRTRGDSKERTIWRSKQNIDFAFLMMYCSEISTYYMQLEDDVISSKHYMKDIKYAIQHQSMKWACIEVASLGFIGKVFKSSDLPKFASFFLTFYNILPCDLLIGYVYTLLGQKRPIHSPSSLFQHIGKVSSLKNKMMPVVDPNFKYFGESELDIAQIPEGDNPPAYIKTNMAPINRSVRPENVYRKKGQAFKTTNARRDHYYQITYKIPLSIKRIIVSTGDEKTKKGILLYGEVYIAESSKNPLDCSKVNKIGSFVEGEFDSYLQGVELPSRISCIYITSRRTQMDNCIIRQISVMLR